MDLRITRRGVGGIALALIGSFAGSLAWAQTAPPVRVRGTIESVNGQMLVIKTRDGASVNVKLADNARVMAFVKASLADIKVGSYIGVTALPDPDGTQRAVAIHIFLEAQRGVAEGHRPWDLRPNTTMTNAAVESTVASVDGQVIMVKYKDGEKKVIVAPNTPIVAYAPGDMSELKPGVHVIIFGATKQPDGTLLAPAINVGRGGIAPPM